MFIYFSIGCHGTNVSLISNKLARWNHISMFPVNKGQMGIYACVYILHIQQYENKTYNTLLMRRFFLRR